MDTEAWGHSPCLRAIITTALLVKATEKIVVGSPLTIFVLHVIEALLNSYHNQHFSVSHLTSYEVLLLIATHITPLHYNNLNSDIFSPLLSTKSFRLSNTDRHFKLPTGPFKVWQLYGFHTISPSCGYKYALVMVCMFSHWTKAFACRQATDSFVCKVLLEKTNPTSGTPLKLYSEQGLHFTGQVLQQVCTVWPFYNTFTVLTMLSPLV